MRKQGKKDLRLESDLSYQFITVNPIMEEDGSG